MPLKTNTLRSGVRLKTVEILGFSGEGSTNSEARAHAFRKAEGALSGDYDPRITAFRNTLCVIYRSPRGWDFSVRGLHWSGRLYASGNYRTFKDAQSAGLHALACLSWDGQEDESPLLTDHYMQQEFRSWSGFQKRYRAWREAGCDDRTAHHKAGHNLLPAADAP